MKIGSKIPYTPYEEGDDEYFNKLNEVNKTKPTADVLAQVINTLEKENQDNEFIEVEVVEKDGTIVKKLMKREKKIEKEKEKKLKNELNEPEEISNLLLREKKLNEKIIIFF